MATLDDIIEKISESSEISKEETVGFVSSLLKLIVQKVKSGDEVDIENLGVFRNRRDISEGEAEEIEFIPHASFASQVNEAFEIFEAIEFSDGISISSNNGGVVESSRSPEFSSQERDSEVSIEEESEDVSQDFPSEKEDTSELKETNECDETGEEQNTEAGKEIDEAEESADESDDDATESSEIYLDEAEEEIASQPVRVKTRFWRGFLYGVIACILIFGIGTWALWKTGIISHSIYLPYFSKQENVDNKSSSGEDQIAKSDNPSDVQQNPASLGGDSISSEELEKASPMTNPSDVVIDTITTTRYLTTMARDHYGNFNFWPYIYKENEHKLGHPNRIKPGTPIVVPELGKYGVNVNNPEDVKKAKKLAFEIYARYQ